MPYIGPWEEYQLFRELDAAEERKSDSAVRVAEEEGKGLRSSSYHLCPPLLQSEKSSTNLQKNLRLRSSGAVAPMPGVGDVFYHSLSDFRTDVMPSSLKDKLPFGNEVDQPYSSEDAQALPSKSRVLLATPFSTCLQKLPTRFSRVPQNAESQRKGGNSSHNDSNDLLDYLKGRLIERPSPFSVSRSGEPLRCVQKRPISSFYDEKENRQTAYDLRKEKGRTSFTVALDLQRLGRLASTRAARASGFPDVSHLKLPRNSFDACFAGIDGNVPSEIEIASRMRYRIYLYQLQQRHKVKEEEVVEAAGGVVVVDHSQTDDHVEVLLPEKVTNPCKHLTNDHKVFDEMERKGCEMLSPNHESTSLKLPSISSSFVPILSASKSIADNNSSAPAANNSSSSLETSSQNQRKRKFTLPPNDLLLDDDEDDTTGKEEYSSLLDWAQQLDSSTI